MGGRTSLKKALFPLYPQLKFTDLQLTSFCSESSWDLFKQNKTNKKRVLQQKLENDPTYLEVASWRARKCRMISESANPMSLDDANQETGRKPPNKSLDRTIWRPFFSKIGERNVSQICIHFERIEDSKFSQNLNLWQVVTGGRWQNSHSAPNECWWNGHCILKTHRHQHPFTPADKM